MDETDAPPPKQLAAIAQAAKSLPDGVTGRIGVESAEGVLTFGGPQGDHVEQANRAVDLQLIEVALRHPEQNRAYLRSVEYEVDDDGKVQWTGAGSAPVAPPQDSPE